ncbi:MAG: amino acid permease, partial [Armatimonadetes bacterium]|nr:amino acid permease [Armatimonadota bacterium]
HDLPPVLAHLHPRHDVPDYGIVLSGGIIVALAVFGTLEGVVAAAAFTILLYYSITNLAALRMPQEGKLVPDAIPVLGLIFCIALAVSLRSGTMASGLALLALGFLLRGLFRRIYPAASP